ncbi:MAG: hypothetical protein WEC72_00595 [Chthoniobacterales bacterium]
MLGRKTIRTRQSAQDNLFGWTIFLILLAAFAAVSWIGSFYIFGHPEKAFSYGLLRTLGKIDAPKRFELTKAPRGQFLDAEKLFERFGKMSPHELAAANEVLLRNYLRNYERTKDLVPYVIGDFNVMSTFRLGPGNFFPDGVVALARANENPSVLLELIFPSAEADAGKLERMLRMGLDLQLARTLDLTALVNVRIMPDGRLNLTAVPLLYGSYSSTAAQGTLNLEPPARLNVSAGLPVLNQAAVDEADQRYATHLQRTGQALHKPALMRVQRTEAVDESTIPVARAEPVERGSVPPAPAPAMNDIPVARAIPVDAADNIPVARAEAVTPADAIPVARAEPVNPAAVPTPTADLQPFAAPSPAAAVPATRQWNVYQPGQMPRGRLLNLDAARGLPAGGSADGVQYLAGDFQVSASGANRAVLRGPGGQQDVRVIVEFPDDAPPPAEGETIQRDAQRPFQITNVEQGPDGQISVYVREITRP